MERKTNMQSIIEDFTSHDIRLTPQRINVYRYLLKHACHPTVDAVYNALKKDNPSLSKTTIYNITDVLTEAGLIKVLHINDGDVRLDADISNHAHFYCKRCDEILDIHMDDIMIPEALSGYQFDDLDVSASGICASCLQREASKT